MRFTALLAALALLGACGLEPEPPEAPRIEAVSVAPFHSQHLVEFKVVDAGSTYMQRLVEHVALDRDRSRGITAETDRWSLGTGQPATDFYLTAHKPAEIERFVADDPTLTVPIDRELAFGRLDDGRWRTYLVSRAVDVDGARIEHSSYDRNAESGLSTIRLDFDRAGAEQLHDTTTRAVGHKLAVLVDGRVVAAPIVNSVIRGGHAELTIAASL